MRALPLLLIALLLVPGTGAAQWRPAWAMESAGAPPPAAELAEPERSASAMILNGALWGAGVGALVFLSVEVFTPHSDHSYDGLLARLTIGAGALLGAAVGAVRAVATGAK